MDVFQAAQVEIERSAIYERDKLALSLEDLYIRTLMCVPCNIAYAIQAWELPRLLDWILDSHSPFATRKSLVVGKGEGSGAFSLRPL